MMAEGEGFEPSVGFPTHAFQACTLSHSVTSPKQPLTAPYGDVREWLVSPKERVVQAPTSH